MKKLKTALKLASIDQIIIMIPLFHIELKVLKLSNNKVHKIPLDGVLAIFGTDFGYFWLRLS